MIAQGTGGNVDMTELQKQFDKTMKSQQSNPDCRCPYCGRCPHCGQPFPQVYPYIPYYPPNAPIVWNTSVVY